MPIVPVTVVVMNRGFTCDPEVRLCNGRLIGTAQSYS